MEVVGAIIQRVGAVQTMKYGDNKGRHIMDVTMLLPNGEPFAYSILENRIYAFDLIRNFKSNKFAVGDTVDFQYNKATKLGYLPTIWRIYNHKRTRDES